MKHRKARTIKTFTVAVILTAQTLLSPLTGVLAAEENNTAGTTTDFTTYSAGNVKQPKIC